MNIIKCWTRAVLICILIVAFIVCHKGDNGDKLFEKKFTEAELHQLEGDAHKLDRISNVSARGYVDTYLELGDAYYYFKQNEKAISAYKKGLRLDSWNCEYQLKLAVLQFRKGALEDAYRGFQFVKSNSRDKRFKEIAQKFFEDAKLQKVHEHEVVLPDRFDYIVYITQFNEVPPLIIDAVASRISQEFKIDVEVTEGILIPSDKNKRDRRELFFDLIIESFKPHQTEKQYRETLALLDIRNSGKLSRSEKEKLAHFYISARSGGEKAWTDVMKSIRNHQYDARILLDQLKITFDKELRDNHVLGVLAITAEDIYTEDYSFLFGWASNIKKVGVISYARFIDEDTPIDVTIKRIVMQVFSSLGFILRIPRCTTPDCARAYPHSLEEHDRKKDYLCKECLSNLKAKYEGLK